MVPNKVTFIPIYPSTNVRSTQGDRWIISSTDEYLQAYDERRYLSNREKLIEQKKDPTLAKKGRTLDRKRQLEKYNDYKKEIRNWMIKNEFIIPHGYFHVKFFIPMPPSWRKKKRASMLAQPHQSTPDFDNLLKALFDALMPRRNRVAGDTGADDRKIHCCAPFKIWCEYGEEGIEIAEYDSGQFLAVFGGNSKLSETITQNTPHNQTEVAQISIF